MSNQSSESKKPVRHILSLSGGKDSSALAVYMRDRVQDMEYAFCYTGEELKETYEYLDRLEAYLGKPITRLNPDRPFSHYLELYRGVLPDARTRWCTRMLKIRPFERFVGDERAVSYIGIRADENRRGYIAKKPNLSVRYPFIEDGIVREDVLRILEDSGLGVPSYYNWRSRSGCYFCFFQQRIEWVGLLEHHPELFQKAMDFEKYDAITGLRFTWSEKESLQELMMPQRIKEIKEEQCKRMESEACSARSKSFLDLLTDESDDQPCTICTL